MVLLIPKKYLIRCEEYSRFTRNGYYGKAKRFVFGLPTAANLEQGYSICIDMENCSESMASYHIKLSEFQINNGFIAIKTEDREAGKKYKRHSFSALDLQALYDNKSLSMATTVLAKVKYYNFVHKSKVIVYKQEYVVANKIGCWLYSDKFDTKRLVGSNGIDILGEIVPNSEDAIHKLLTQHKTRREKLLDSLDEIIDASNIVTSMQNQAKKLAKNIEATDKDVYEHNAAIEDHLSMLQNKYESKISKIREEISMFDEKTLIDELRRFIK